MARQAIADQGTEISLNDVADQAGVTRMTLYRHFGPRQQLLLEVLLDELVGLAEECESMLRDQELPVVQRAHAAAVIMASRLRKSPLAASVMATSTLGDLGRLDPSGEVYALVERVVQPFFAEAEAEGLLRGSQSSTTQWMARQLVAVMYQLPWERDDIAALSRELAYHFIPSMFLVSPAECEVLAGKHGASGIA